MAMAMSSISDLLYDVFNCADLDILNGAGSGSGSGCIDGILELAESSTLSELMDSPIFSTDASLFSFQDLFSHSKLPFLEQPDCHPAAAAKKELGPVGDRNTVLDGRDANNAAKKARRTLWLNPEPEAVKNQLSLAEVQAALPQNKKSKHGGDREKEDTKDNRMTHITVERNRRKQMNDNLAILRALMPTSYVQRGDQASIVGGVVEFVKELQQLLQSLEGQKQRKAYVESLSSQTISGMTTTSIRSSALAQTSTATTATNTTLQIQLNTSSSTSPRSSQQSIGFCPQLQQRNVQQLESDGDSYRSGLANHELGASSKSAVAQVEVKISGSNVHLNTVSKRAPGQLLSIISTLEILSLQILHLNITTLDSGATILYNFTLKIGIDCKLCVDELAEAVQGILREAHAVKGSKCHPA